jgi:hypothetical protein
LNILFVHQNFTGQFKHLAPALVQRDHSVKALRQAQKSLPFSSQGVILEQWQAQRGTCLDAHPWAQVTETKLIRAEAAAVAADELIRKGWSPVLIVGQPGWGEMLFLHHIWPQVRQLYFLGFSTGLPGLMWELTPNFHSRIGRQLRG